MGKEKDEAQPKKTSKRKRRTEIGLSLLSLFSFTSTVVRRRDSSVFYKRPSYRKLGSFFIMKKAWTNACRFCIISKSLLLPASVCVVVAF